MKDYSNALLYVDQKEGAKQAKSLIDQFRGILKTTAGRGSDKMLMVDYKPEVIGILEMVKYLDAQGLATKRIDL